MSFKARLPAQAGIAIGPILFVLALLAILGMVMAAGSGDFGTASIADRIAADIPSQAILIRTKIQDCNMKYHNSPTNYDGYPSSLDGSGNAVPTLVSSLTCADDPHPPANATDDRNLWSGARPTTLPQPPTNFDNWYYLNTNTAGNGGTATGGRCVWIAPSIASPLNSLGLVSGLKMAANKFTAAAGYSPSAEVVYNPASASQKFVLWITLPTGAPDSHCLP